MPHRAINARIRAIPGMAALVGDRVRPLEIEQQTAYPAVLYEVWDADALSTMRGDARLRSAWFTAEVWAPRLTDALAVAKLLRSGLARWGGEAGGVTVQQIFFQAQGEFRDPDLRVHRVYQEYRIWYEEA